MENTPGVDPAQQIVADLNADAGVGTYARIDTGVIGSDAIRVGLVYKPGAVTPVGAFEILDSSVDPDFLDTKNRPALAQSFEEVSTGARFTVAVNHFKSKGSDCNDVADPDLGDGQGNCNLTRKKAAEALAEWLAGDPTSSGDPDVLVVGDLNSYAKEDPVAALRTAGYTDLVAAFGGSGAYSYVFDGQLGYLDHALANATLAPQVTGVAEWHINADEVPLFDYNDDVRDPGEASFEEESDALALFAADPYRTSDHDPVLIGLDLVDRAPELGGVSASPNPAAIGTTVQATVSFSDAEAYDRHTAVWSWGDGTTSAGTVVESAGEGTVSGSHTYPAAGAYTVTVTIEDGSGNTDQATSQIIVYDPIRFVTGGGWFHSPAGAYTADQSRTGRATFELRAKYPNGGAPPAGELTLRFPAGDLELVATSIEWSVITGSTARLHGVGAVNGIGGHRFTVTVTDAAPDTIRVRIWKEAAGSDEVVYETAAPVALGGGNVVIHK